MTLDWISGASLTTSPLLQDLEDVYWPKKEEKKKPQN